MDDWTPRTLAHDIVETCTPSPAGGVQARTLSAGAPPPELRQKVKCACGRHAWPFEMVDVRALPVAVRGTAEYACCACRVVMVREGRTSQADLLEALGAPAEMVGRAHSAS